MNKIALSASSLELITELFTEDALVTGDALNQTSGNNDSNLAINWSGNAGSKLRILLDTMGGSEDRGERYQAILDNEISLMNAFFNTANSTTDYKFSGQIYAMQADILRKGNTLTGNLGNQSWATSIEDKWDDLIDEVATGTRATHLKGLVNAIAAEVNSQWNGGTVGAAV